MTALLFDCDGVLADTERDGHLPAFNAMFVEFGLPAHWDEDEYARRLKIGGGKERLASLFGDPQFIEKTGIGEDSADRAALLASWHRSKTQKFKGLVAAGKLPARPGIARIIPEALAAGWQVAVASTSAAESVRAVLEHAVGIDTAAQVTIFAGDVVPAKKPDPAIYLLAVGELDLDPADTLVIEDSRNGLLAATRAGLACVVTVNGYTRAENFDEAVLVVSDLGDPHRPPIEVLAAAGDVRPGDYLTLDDLSACLRVSATPPGGAPPAEAATASANSPVLQEEGAW